MIDFEVAVATKHQAVVAMKFNRINDAASADGCDGQANQGLGRHIGHHRHLNLAVALQDAE